MQELVPLRYGRMLRTPFTFFRGAAYLMAADLAGTPRTGLTVQLCGDAHLSNFGSFAAPDRRLLFGLNDFDETLPGPFEWDLKRLVASFAVAGRDRGFDTGQRESINRAVASGYRLAMLEMAQMRRLDLWYLRLEVDQVAERVRTTMKPDVVKRFERNLAKARAKDSAKAFAKLVEMVDGQPRFVGDPPLIVPLGQLLPDMEHQRLWEVLRTMMRSYRRSLQDEQPAPDRGLPLRGGRPEGGGCRERGDARLGDPDDGRTASTTRCSSSSRRRSPPCWSRSSERASTPATGNGSWKVNA